MQRLKQMYPQRHPNAQRGVSLSGLIVVLALIGVVAVFAMKVLPTYLEYRSVKEAIAHAKAGGGSVRDMQISFNKSADINRIDAITGKDLVISKEADGIELSFAYQKKIPIATNVSLLIDYAGTTANDGVVAAKPDTAAK